MPTGSDCSAPSTGDSEAGRTCLGKGAGAPRPAIPAGPTEPASLSGSLGSGPTSVSVQASLRGQCPWLSMRKDRALLGVVALTWRKRKAETKSKILPGSWGFELVEGEGGPERVRWGVTRGYSVLREEQETNNSVFPFLSRNHCPPKGDQTINSPAGRCGSVD